MNRAPVRSVGRRFRRELRGGLQVRGPNWPALVPTPVGPNYGPEPRHVVHSLLVQRSALFRQFTGRHARPHVHAFGEDSIYHPDIKIKPRRPQDVRATRQTEGVGQQPFVDTYHAVEMEVEAVEWELNGPSVEFRRLTSDRPEPAAFGLDCLRPMSTK